LWSPCEELDAAQQGVEADEAKHIGASQLNSSVRPTERREGLTMRLTTAVVIAVMMFTIDVARGSSPAASTEPPASDRQDLVRMFDEDQADREGATIDWTFVLPRDHARLAKVKELFTTGGLRTGGDYYRAAMILQHGTVPEDFLLAHEFCVAAMALGKADRTTRWLAAASEDRFLMNLDRPQRFGTQYRFEGSEPMRLYRVGEGVTDELRRIMATPTLAEAKAQEAAFAKK
jgi:hypothetical protein